VCRWLIYIDIVNILVYLSIRISVFPIDSNSIRLRPIIVVDKMAHCVRINLLHIDDYH
jgi:hypothetical protein